MCRMQIFRTSSCVAYNVQNANLERLAVSPCFNLYALSACMHMEENVPFGNVWYRIYAQDSFSLFHNIPLVMWRFFENAVDNDVVDSGVIFHFFNSCIWLAAMVYKPSWMVLQVWIHKISTWVAGQLDINAKLVDLHQKHWVCRQAGYHLQLPFLSATI